MLGYSVRDDVGASFLSAGCSDLRLLGGNAFGVSGNILLRSGKRKLNNSAMSASLEEER